MSSQADQVLRFFIQSVGLLGPGFSDWNSGRGLLADPAGWQPAATVLPSPLRLPPAERRRAGDIVKLSLAVADEACTAAELSPADLATVFTASSGDANNCHILCEALAGTERLISPTRFTNSVHNAAAGYWHIATASQAPSTSLCVRDASFAGGLLEAAIQSNHGKRPVLLVAAEVPYPEPMQSVRPIGASFGVGLLLNCNADQRNLAAISLRLGAAKPASICGDEGLDALRLGVPAARSLPLLQAMARGQARELVLDYLSGTSLSLQITPAEQI